tara:strand:+ start:2061 stop:2831 length:771 start_codon:yes stop_codon:yes gene_type:complete
MRYGKKRTFDAPYETLSDIAIGSLGVFIILVVVVVIISTLHSTGASQIFQKIKDKNDFYELEIIQARKESDQYKSNNYAKMEIRQLRLEFDKTKRKLDRTSERLDLEKERLQTNKAEFEQATSVLDVIDQKRKEHADFVVEMEKLEVQLQSLIDKQTGFGVDRTGRPFLVYGTFTPDYLSPQNDSLYLIGKEGVFTKDTFYALLKSFRHEGDNSFFIRFSSSNSRYNQDYSEPQWSNDWWSKAGWKRSNIPKKKDY